MDIENSQRNFKNIVDPSPAAIFIFSNNDELQYLNTLGKELLKNQFKSSSTSLDGIFNKEQYTVIKHLEKSNSDAPYIEIEANNNTRFSIKLVNIIYNDAPAKLISLTDITLQYQFNTQRRKQTLSWRKK